MHSNSKWSYVKPRASLIVLLLAATVLIGVAAEYGMTGPVPDAQGAKNLLFRPFDPNKPIMIFKFRERGRNIVHWYELYPGRLGRYRGTRLKGSMFESDAWEAAHYVSEGLNVYAFKSRKQYQKPWVAWKEGKLALRGAWVRPYAGRSEAREIKFRVRGQRYYYVAITRIDWDKNGRYVLQLKLRD